MTEARERWPDGLTVKAVRFARHTTRLEEIVAFYADGVGLPIIGSFEDHDGYSGVMFGLPGSAHQLEFTSSGAETMTSEPSPDDLFVLYFASNSSLDAVVERLRTIAEVGAPANPYWQTKEKTTTFLDPDGWQVVLVYAHDV